MAVGTITALALAGAAAGAAANAASKSKKGGAVANPSMGNILAELVNNQGELLSAEGNFAPEYVERQMRNLQQTFTGTEDTPGVPAMYLDAVRAADPESARLLDLLTNQTLTELEADNQLDPAQNRLVEQSSRASAAARGMGFGPSDAFAETLAKLNYGENLRTQRKGNALTVRGLRDALTQRGLDLAAATSTATTPTVLTNDDLAGIYGVQSGNAQATAANQTRLRMQYNDQMNSLYGGLTAGLLTAI